MMMYSVWLYTTICSMPTYLLYVGYYTLFLRFSHLAT